MRVEFLPKYTKAQCEQGRELERLLIRTMHYDLTKKGVLLSSFVSVIRAHCSHRCRALK